MGFFQAKQKHAYMCYKKGVPREKVYAVVEKGDKYLVIQTSRGDYKYMLAGGGVEKGEDMVTAIKRECLEELNVVVEYVRTLGTILDTSEWEYKGKKFTVQDKMDIVYTRYVSHVDGMSMGIEGEFDKEDSIVEIDRDEMLSHVAEFTKYGIKL